MKILYISHITWGWIKQRPQFIAEELAKDNQVDVYYRKILNWKLQYMNKNNKSSGNLRLHSYINLPIYRIFKFVPIKWLDRINKILWNLNRIDYSKYDIVYLCDCSVYDKIKQHVPAAKIFYDCMDDKQSFPGMQAYPKYKQYCYELEKELIKQAGIVTCTADYLKNALINRYNINRQYYVVNNAISNNLFNQTNTQEYIQLPANSFTYIGTVAEWFDFDLVLSVLNKIDDINIIIFGPTGDVPEKYKHPRLIFKGPIKHDKILAAMKASTGLIMPFKVNELIRSVNPVKLYEYIYSGKPSAAVRYEESEKFKEYVYLYSSIDEFIDFINIAKSCNGIYEPKQVNAMKSFALNNTWEARTMQIIDIIKNTNMGLSQSL